MAELDSTLADPLSSRRLRLRLFAGVIAFAGALATVGLASVYFVGWPNRITFIMGLWVPAMTAVISVIFTSVYARTTLLQSAWASSLESNAVREDAVSPARLESVLASAHGTATSINDSKVPPLPIVSGQKRALALYLRMFAEPTSVVTRISEQVEPRTASQIVKTSYTLALSEDLSGRVVVPLFRAPRGRIQDGLRFYGPQEERISSLNHAQGVSFALGVIRSLVKAASPLALPEYEKWMERDLGDLMLNGVFYSTTGSPSLQSQITTYTAAFGKLDGVDGYRLQVIMSILSAHLGADVVYVSFDVAKSDSSLGPRSIRVAVERTDPKLTTSVSRESNPWSQRWIFRLLPHVRRIFGVETTIYRHSLAYAELSDSYHLSIAGPPGTYLAKQVLQPRRASTDLSLSSSHAVLGPRRGQRHSHAYVRNDGTLFRDLELVATFYERPPGAIMAALLSASAASIITLLIALRSLLPVTNNVPPTDLIAILLAFPAGIALWAGFNENARQSLSALASKATTIIGCILAAFAAVLGPNENLDLAQTWFIIWGVLTVNVVACLVSLGVRVRTSATVQKSNAEPERD